MVSVLGCRFYSGWGCRVWGQDGIRLCASSLGVRKALKFGVEVSDLGFGVASGLSLL